MDANPMIYAVTAVPVALVFIRLFRRDTPPPEPPENDTTADS